MTPERSPADVALESGTLLDGRYRLEEPIGSGGLAVVWLALDEVLDRRVAVKLLRPETADDGENLERFRREAMAAAGLTHTHTITVYDVGEHEGRPFLVMEFLEGPTLADLVDAKGRVPAALVVEIGRQVASALSAGHERGLVHRDVTPTNILFTADGMTKLTDFGIALVPERSSEPHDPSATVFGTVGYLAPERLRDEDIDARADVFALGVILHECLTGERRMGSTDPEGPPRDLRATIPDAPDALTQVVARATEADPDDRFADGGELVAALEPLGDPELARDALAQLVASTVPRRPRPQSRPHTVPLHLDEGADTMEVSVAPPTAPGGPPAPDGPAEDTTTGPPPLSPAPVVSGASPEPTTEPPAAHHPGAQPRQTAGRTVLWLALGFVALAAIAATIVGGVGERSGSQEASRAGREVPAAGPVPVRAAADFDPLGDGSEHGDEVAAAFDGDPASAWTTERYERPDLGGLKSGVGIWFDLGEPRPIRLIDLDLTAGGGDVDVYAFEAEPQGDPAGSGPPVAQVTGAQGGTRVEFDEPVEGRYWLLWFTRVDGGRGGVNEARFLTR